MNPKDKDKFTKTFKEKVFDGTPKDEERTKAVKESMEKTSKK